MLLPRPDFRAQRTLERLPRNDPPDNPVERTFFVRAGTANDSDPPAPIDIAWDLYRTPERHVLDAAILTGAPDRLLEEALGLKPEILELYRYLFCDVSVFRHVFEIHRYLRSLISDGTPEFKSYELAVVEGYEISLSRYRLGEPPPMDAQIMTDRMVHEFFLRSREHRGKPLTSATAQQSLKAAENVGKLAASLRAMQPKNGEILPCNACK